MFLSEIQNFKRELLDYFRLRHAELLKQIDTQKQLTEEMENEIVEAVKEFKK